MFVLSGVHERAEVRNTQSWKEFEAEFPDAAKRKNYETLMNERNHLERVNEVEELGMWERWNLNDCPESNWPEDHFDSSDEEAGADGPAA